MKDKSRILLLFLCFLMFLSIASCTKHSNKLEGLWVGTQASISEVYEGSLDKYSIYYFYEDNTLDLGNYDYISKDYNHNYVWLEKGIKYEWVDENTIDIRYKGSNVFKVSIEGSKLTLESKDYCIEFEKGESEGN